MGNTETALKSRHLILDKAEGEVHEDWNVCPGKLEDAVVTIFSAIHPPSSRKREFMEKALQCSKIYRHPNILRFVDGGIREKEVIVVTERATPLLDLLLHDQISSLQIIAGLSSIIEALVFLHDKAGVSHNNVCSSSIYVTSDGSWKLWGFEYLCSFGDLTRDHIERINQYCSESCLPPDDKSRISPAYLHSRDCYFFGKFVVQMVAPLMPPEILYFEEFLSSIQTNALHPDWNQRPRLSILLEEPLFNHEFLKLRQKLNNILLLSVADRNELIETMPSMLLNYSDKTVAMTFGPLILCRSFMLIPSASKYLMPLILTPKATEDETAGIFSREVFKEFIVPLLLRLFRMHDAIVRNILLSSFHEYAALISIEILTRQVLPQILLGIRDTDESLVCLTLRCLACLIPILGADIVIGKRREQIFTSSTPKSESKCYGTKRRKLPRKMMKPPIIDTTTIKIKEDDNLPAELGIPERSSPDGGEVTDDIYLFNEEEEESWSDWEEIMEPPPSHHFDNGVLQVKTDEPEKKEKNISTTNISTNKFSSATEGSINTNKGLNKILSKELGHEYDIMSVKIEPKSEFDLFSDLTPKLNKSNYDLETMLLAASSRTTSRTTRVKQTSLSDTLAQLQMLETTEEGDAWNDDNDQVFCVDES